MFVLLVFSFGIFLRLAKSSAFSSRDLFFVNVVIPMIQSGIRAQRNRRPIGPALLQAAAGGLIMQKGFEMAGKVDEKTSWRAWQAKFLVNCGASLAETAGKEKFVFRMDIGPVWVYTHRGGLKFKFGVHGLISPLLNYSDGARFDVERTLRYGTVAMQKDIKFDGTISSNGALAYSNTNNFITNQYGSHVGHELVHTFQYRRDAFLTPRFGNLAPGLRRWFPDYFLDDTGWAADWGIECLIAAIRGDNKDFDILLEREAYYLSKSRH